MMISDSTVELLSEASVGEWCMFTVVTRSLNFAVWGAVANPQARCSEHLAYLLEIGRILGATECSSSMDTLCFPKSSARLNELSLPKKGEKSITELCISWTLLCRC